MSFKEQKHTWVHTLTLSFRRILFLGAFGIFIFFWECSQIPDLTGNVSAGEIVCNVGDVHPDSSASRSVRIINDTSSNVRIESVSRSCTCLATGLDSDLLEPWNSTKLTVQFNTPKQQGPFEHQLLLELSGRPEPLCVRIRGTVSAWIQPSLPEIKLQNVFAGDSASIELTLKVSDPWPVKERRMQCTLPYSRIECVNELPEGAGFQLKVCFDPPKDATDQLFGGELTIDWLGFEERSIIIPCIANIVSKFVVEPSQVFIGNTNAKPSPNSKFHVKVSAQLHARQLGRWRDGITIVVNPPTALEVELRPTSAGLEIHGSLTRQAAEVKGASQARISLLGMHGQDLVQIPVYWETDP